ncbi:serine hydrolase [Candidatus Microgenomates bacterium]|nr:serine hydrolase [Candidatus Microgenomates bacterium]
MENILRYSHSSRRPKHRFSPKRFLFGLVFLLILFLVLKWSGGFFIKDTLQDSSELLAKDSFDKSKKSLADLEKDIKELVDTKKGSWSVYFVDYSKDQSLDLNKNVIHRAASVNKLFVLASAYFLADRKEIDLDETISLQARDIQDYGTGTIRYDAPGTIYSLKTLARLLIEKSDNTAEYILRTVIGDGKIQSLIESWGMKQTSLSDNKTSLSDVELLFKKIKNNEIAGFAATAEMFDFLLETDFEDRLPALLPKDVSVFHKIGNEVGNIHDVGLIKKGDATYFLGVLSSDINDTEEEAVKTIAKISQMVYDFKYGNK